MPALSLTFGVIVGFSLGLTGGGGSLFAVPLLVYGLSIDPRQAVGISLAAVGITSAVGFLERWRSGQVEISTGLMFAMAGMAGAPLGAWLSTRIPESLLLTLFALLMLVVATRLWQKAGSSSAEVTDTAAEVEGPAYGRDEVGRLRLTSPRAVRLGAVGVLTGVMSGLFGVGSGFVIVPALILFSGMGILRAVGTSLLVIALISASGVTWYLWTGHEIPIDTTLYFVGGGTLGMFAGTWASRYLSGPALQKIFAMAIVAVAVFVILRTTLHL